jgi:hypothetical protein
MSLSIEGGKSQGRGDGNSWSADTTKAAFLGMTAHWIEVKEKKWKLRSEVIVFQAISGAHDSDNLGRYFTGLCDRVGICSQKGTKVCHLSISDVT